MNPPCFFHEEIAKASEQMLAEGLQPRVEGVQAKIKLTANQVVDHHAAVRLQQRDALQSTSTSGNLHERPMHADHLEPRDLSQGVSAPHSRSKQHTQDMDKHVSSLPLPAQAWCTSTQAAAMAQLQAALNEANSSRERSEEIANFMAIKMDSAAAKVIRQRTEIIKLEARLKLAEAQLAQVQAEMGAATEQFTPLKQA